MTPHSITIIQISILLTLNIGCSYLKLINLPILFHFSLISSLPNFPKIPVAHHKIFHCYGPLVKDGYSVAYVPQDSLWYQFLPPWTTSRNWDQTVYSETERQHDRNAQYHGGHWKTHFKCVISVTYLFISSGYSNCCHSSKCSIFRVSKSKTYRYGPTIQCI